MGGLGENLGGLESFFVDSLFFGDVLLFVEREACFVKTDLRVSCERVLDPLENKQSTGTSEFYRGRSCTNGTCSIVKLE